MRQREEESQSPTHKKICSNESVSPVFHSAPRVAASCSNVEVNGTIDQSNSHQRRVRPPLFAAAVDAGRESANAQLGQQNHNSIDVHGKCGQYMPHSSMVGKVPKVTGE